MIYRDAPEDPDQPGEARRRSHGFFARAFCKHEFAEHGLVNRSVQANNSLSARKGTLRGVRTTSSPPRPRPRWSDASAGRSST